MKKLLIGTVFLSSVLSSMGQQIDSTMRKSFEVYGFAQMDAGYNANQTHPDWYDVARPTKLPSYKNQYGTDGNAYFSVRQTRLGFKSYTPTRYGILKTHVEGELFGVGVDAGQTTLRLRHAYGELGHWGAGQTWSPFMDIDVFPNTLEYWGPSGMVFYRNVQIRYMPIQEENQKLTFALERPGGSGDLGIYSERLNNPGLKSQFPTPDLSAEYRKGGDFGYVELAGIVRYMKWKDMNAGSPNYQMDLSGNAIGWGLNLSSNINFGKKLVGRFQAVYGEGIQNYMNDATVDVGAKSNAGDPKKPIVGVPLPCLGLVAFFDKKWNDKFTSSIGYSSITMTNSNGQDSSAFKKGQYVAVNLLYYPVQNVMMGFEVQYVDRANYLDGFTSNMLKFQFSFKYNFLQEFYKKK